MFNKYASGIKNEIINALECLHKRILQSKFAEEVTETEIMGLVNAPKLINRQKAKIKEFDEKLVIQQGLIDYQKAEIERLNIELQSMRNAANSYKMHYETAKSEAIKEFAKRLKCGVPQETGVIRCADVDNLVKEMTE